MTKPIQRWTPGEFGKPRVDSRTGYAYQSRIHPVTGKRENALVHRLVMEELLGRALYPGENVHHINGNKSDNRPENLERWDTSQPSGQRIEDKIKYAQELLDKYAPQMLASNTGGI